MRNPVSELQRDAIVHPEKPGFLCQPQNSDKCPQETRFLSANKKVKKYLVSMGTSTIESSL